MIKCIGCEVNDGGWCMYYNESVKRITKCSKDKEWVWYPEGDID